MYNTCSAMTEAYFSLNVTVSEINGFCGLSMQQPPAFLQRLEHFNPQMLNVTQEQVILPLLRTIHVVVFCAHHLYYVCAGSSRSIQMGSPKLMVYRQAKTSHL